MTRPKILIVEDEVIIAEDLRQRLIALGYSVAAIASSGKQALRVAEETRPDLVLMDIVLKEDMDGIEAAERIREQFGIPVIYATAYADDSMLERARISEPYGYLMKPFKDGELKAAITIVLYRHEIEKKLKRTERWLSATLRSISDSVIAIDDRGRVTFMNPVAEALTGHREEEALGQEIARLVQFKDEETGSIMVSPMIIALNEQSVAGASDHTLLVGKDGKETPVTSSASPIRNDKGAITGVVSVFSDATERRRMEASLEEYRRNLEKLVEARTSELRAANERLRLEVTGRERVEVALRESERYYRSLLHNMHDDILVIDRDYRIRDANKSFLDSIGHRREEVVGRLCYEIYHGQSQPIEDCVLPGVIETGKPASLRHTHLRKDGSKLWLDILVSPVIDEDGQTTQVIHAVRDVSKEVRLQTQLSQAQKMEAVGTLAGGIAHHFNNILGIMLGYASAMLLDAPEGSQLHGNLEAILKAGRRAADLVKQMLTFSCPTGGERKPLGIGLLMEETLRLFCAAMPPSLNVRYRNETVPSTGDTVLADPGEIHVLLLNLLGNARDAIGERQGVIDVCLSSTDSLQDVASSRLSGLAPGPYLCLTVRDTGIGMDRPVLDRIFEPYFTTKDLGKGTGLGLSVAYGIVKRHGGAITVSSEPKVGTTFCVYLPRLPLETELYLGESGPIPEMAGSILLVDDELGLVDSGRQMLERLGCQVTAMTSSSDALDAFRSQPEAYDLVITDQTMPRITGIELAAEILRIRPQTPIILCTGLGDFMTPEKLKAAGIADLLSKPVSLRDLTRTVRRALGLMDTT